MQHPGLAARRFYRAFYRWNLISSHTERQRPSPAVCASAFHSTGRHHDDQAPRTRTRLRRRSNRGSDADHISLIDLPTARSQQRVSDDDRIQASKLKIRRHKTYGPAAEGFETTRLYNIRDRLERQDARSRAEEQEPRPQGRSKGNDSSGGAAPDRRDVPRAMLEDEVVSADVKPFHTMAADEYVVRFRSEAGLMMEYAISGDILGKVQIQYGARLERLRDRTGARIEVQELFRKQDGADDSKPQNLVHSVLISGTFKEVADVYGDLRTNYSHAQAVKLDISTHTEREPLNDKSPEGKRYNKEWLNDPIQSTTDLPSSSMRLSQMVVRSRTPDHLVLERVVSGETVAKWQTRFGEQLEFLTWRYGCDITIKPLHSRQELRDEQAENQRATETLSSTWYTLLVAGSWESQRIVAGQLTGARKNFLSEAEQPSAEPSDQLTPGSSVFRQSPNMDLTLELAVTDIELKRVMAETEFARLARVLKLTVATQHTKLRQGLANRVRRIPDISLRDLTGRAELEGHLITLAGPKSALITMRTAFNFIMGEVWKTGNKGEEEKARKTVETITPHPRHNIPGGNSEMFTALVEICPEDDQYRNVRAHVIARQNNIRRTAHVGVFSLVPTTGLFGISGNEDNVQKAKEKLLEVLNEAYQKFRIPPQGFRVIHERRNWQPSWPEIHAILAQVDGRSTQDRSDKSLELWRRGALYRCVVKVSGPNREKVMHDAQLVSPVEQLKSASGCQDVAVAKDAFIAHGSLDSILKFRHAVRNAIEKMRDLTGERSTKIEAHVHASLSSIWARMSSLDDGDDADRARRPQLAEDVRIALRPLSHPVVLITSQDPSFSIGEVTRENESSGSIHRCRGVTVSSFNTVSLRSDPLVAFNIKVPSSTWAALSASGDLRIHLLTATPRGAAIADAFTKKSANPFSGFLRLEKLGVDVTYFDENAPPRVNDKEGVLAELHAKLQPEQCVKVGDHIIVVARVISCRLPGGKNAATPLQMDSRHWESIGGLAYAKQEYRNVGERIFPEGGALLPEDLPDPLSLGDDSVEQKAPRTPFKLDVGQRNRQGTEVRSTRDQPIVKPGEEVAFEKAMGIYENLSPAAREEEDEYDFGFETPNYGVKRDPRTSAATGESGEARCADALWGPDDVVREDSIRLGGGSADPGVGNISEENKPDGRAYRPTAPNAVPPGSHSFSTFSRPMALHSRSSRHFSTAAHSTQKSISHVRDIDQLVEASARNMNVADYLGVPETGRFHSHRARSLFRMNKEARRAEKQLLKRDTELTEEDKAELRQKITTNDRIISKKLAWNAAYHLRIMLDKGRVDFKRAQFLESAIEKGQAILLEEATLVRGMYNQGKITFDRLQVVKEKLARDAEVYQTELTRLGQIVDEEGDAGAVFPGAGQEGGADPFDGFRGNR